MLSKISILCFAASYGAALGLECTRLLFRSRLRATALLGFVVAGLFAHTVFLLYQGANYYSRPPLSSTQHWYLAAAWLLAAVYLYLTLWRPGVQFGLFFLPLVLGLIGVGTFLASPEPGDAPIQLWGLIHGGSMLLATVSVLVGVASGLMYLGQSRRLKHKLPPLQQGLRLPSLEWLQQANSHALRLALAMVGVSIVSGVILNVIRRGPEGAPLRWSDPVVLSTLAMFAWLAASTAVGLFHKSAREGRKVAYFTLLSACFLAIALAVVLAAGTEHGAKRPPAASSEAEAS